MPTLQAWISQSPAGLEVVAPLRARARGALHALLGIKSQPGGARLMARGAERC